MNMNDAKLRTQKANYCSDWLINYLRRSLNLERFQLFRILKIAQKKKYLKCPPESQNILKCRKLNILLKLAVTLRYSQIRPEEHLEHTRVLL